MLMIFACPPAKVGEDESCFPSSVDVLNQD